MMIPWLSKKRIARAAARLLDDYACVIQAEVQPPVPVENIIERGLKLRLGFVDLRSALEMDDVLGATYIKQRKICVDKSLVDGPSEGRLCFTCAHETGHWILHRKLIDHACRSDQQNGFIFCRIKDARKAIEWQADYFASCLLMPEAAVRKAFGSLYGSEPLIIHNLKSSFRGPLGFDPCVENWPLIAANVKNAGGFSNVSKQAMIIRLQELSLVKNETRARLSWDESFALT
jgi:Zn-dependent peptidase ImmA (M78 family)